MIPKVVIDFILLCPPISLNELYSFDHNLTEENKNKPALGIIAFLNNMLYKVVYIGMYRKEN